MVVVRGWGDGDGDLVFRGPEFPFYRMKRVGDGGQWRLHNSVGDLDVTELCL